MKRGQLLKSACKAICVAAVVSPMIVSCYDDTALRNELGSIAEDMEALEEKVRVLESTLTGQSGGLQSIVENIEKAVRFSIDSLGGVVDGNYEDFNEMLAELEKTHNGSIKTIEDKLASLVTVKEVTGNADGSTTITLSDGNSFVVYPKYVDPYKKVITTTIVEGVTVWAYYEDGIVKPLTDAEGNTVPVVKTSEKSLEPQFKVEEGFVWVSFDGENWQKTGVAEMSEGNCECTTIFSGYQVNYTEVDPQQWWIESQPKTVTFELPDGLTVTLDVDAYAAFEFAYETCFIYYGKTQSVPVAMNGIENYILQLPNGWNVEEVYDNYNGTMFNITAPAKELVMSNAAPAEAVIKALAVTEGGKSIVSTLIVTCAPFKTFSYAKNAFTIEPNGGLEQYIYGICPVAEYDSLAIYEGVKAYWDAIKASDWSAQLPAGAERGYGEYETPAADLYAGELEPGVEYVLWTLPCIYETFEVYDEYYGEWYTDGSYTVYQDLMVTKTFMLQEVKVETNVCTFNDINVTVTVNGIDSYFADFLELDEYTSIESVVENLNSMISNGYGYPIENTWTEPFTGNPIEFVDGYGEILPGRKYMLYVIPYVEGATSYSVEDAFVFEFETEALLSGSSIAVTAEEATTTYNSISVPISAEGAAMIYYKWVDPVYVSATTVENVLETGYIVKGSSEEVAEYNLAAGTARTLLAVAVDENGCYGEMYVKEYSTNSLTYSDLTISAEIVGDAASTTQIKLTASEEPLNWYYYNCASDYYMWLYTIGPDAAAAGEKFQLNASAKSYYTQVAPADLTDGIITLENLEVGESYVFCVIAQDSTSYTKAYVLEFEVKQNLGEFVRAVDPMTGEANPLWEAAKPTVHDLVIETDEFVTVRWDIDVPEGYTVAKSVCYDPQYLASIVTPEDKVRHLLVAETWYGEYVESEGDWDENDNWVDTPLEDPYWATQGGVKGALIYIVLQDAAGNYYEAYTYDPQITSNGGFGV